jgi:hypothetical protein
VSLIARLRTLLHRGGGAMPKPPPVAPGEERITLSAGRVWRDAGPPHNGPLCFGPTGDWLCRQRADNGHSDHIPYIEGEYRTYDA